MLDTQNYTFLIVDDQDLIIQLLRGILRSNGYRKLSTANSGKAALTILKKTNIDFVITDWEMPKMSGVELLIKIRSDSKYHNMPVLMVTGEMSEDKVIYAVEEGVDGYQQKPFTEERIMDAIRSIFRKRLNPDEIQHQIQKLSLLKIYERYDEAKDYAQQLLMQKEHPTVLSILAECYFSSGDFENARKYIDRLMDIKIDSKALNLLGNICMKEEKYEEALQYYKQASIKNPLNRSRKIELGKVYVKLGLANEATEIFSDIAKTNPTDLNLVDMGKVYLDSGDIKEAGNFLDQTIDPIPQTVETFNKYAVELRKIGQHEAAIQQYLKCLSLVPGNDVILYNLGRIYFEIGRIEEAIVALEECIKSNNSKPARRLLDYLMKNK